MLLLLIFITTSGAIQIYVNNVAPFANPSETYSYYSLPYCQPDNLEEMDQSMGQAMSGDHKLNSLYVFNASVNNSLICNATLNEYEQGLFKTAITDDYYAEFYLGDIRMHDRVGMIFEGKYLIKNKIQFNIYHKGNILIDANISVSDSDFVELTKNIQFYFSAVYIDSENNNHIDQLEQEGDSDFKWSLFSIKFALIIFLLAQVCCLMRRILNRDFVQISDDESNITPVGWKQIRVEATSPPRNKIILASFLGLGIQFTILTFILLAIGVSGIYDHHKGSIKSTAVIIYSFTGVFNGYYAGKYYKFFGGKSWSLSIILSVTIFPASILSIFLIVNTIAYMKESTATIPFTVLFFLAFLFIVVYIPLTVLGGVAGRLRTIDQLPQQRLKKNIPKPINYQPHYALIPFFSIIVELNYILNATWGHDNFHEYLLMLTSLVQLFAIIGCISVILTYKQLNCLDYRWQWQSFTNGGFTAIYVFLFLIYRYLAYEMHGILQFSFYFAYSSLGCIVLAAILGTVSYLVSMRFVFYIYASCKMY